MEFDFHKVYKQYLEYVKNMTEQGKDAVDFHSFKTGKYTKGWSVSK